MEMLMEFSVWFTAAASTVVLGLLKKIMGVKDTSFEALLGKVAKADGAIVNVTKGIQPLFLAYHVISPSFCHSSPWHPRFPHN